MEFRDRLIAAGIEPKHVKMLRHSPNLRSEATNDDCRATFMQSP